MTKTEMVPERYRAYNPFSLSVPAAWRDSSRVRPILPTPEQVRNLSASEAFALAHSLNK